MKLVLEIDITADGVQDYEDIASEMYKLTRHFDQCWRDDVTLSVGDEGPIRDRNGNPAGKWQIVDTPRDDQGQPFEYDTEPLPLLNPGI